MTKIDGNEIAKEMVLQLEKFPGQLKIVLVGNDKASQVFVEKKRQIAEKLGVDFELKKFPESVNEQEILIQLSRWQEESKKVGIVIQLPLPKHLDRDKIISAIKPENDVDGLLFCLGSEKEIRITTHTETIHRRDTEKNNSTIEQYNNVFTPPVVLAIERAIKETNIDLNEKKVAIIGRGFLVGQPAACYLAQKYPQTKISVLGKGDSGFSSEIKTADFIIGAASTSSIITPDMVKEGTVLIDAGSAEVGGALKGNIDQKSYQKASFYTPVPGGIGPMTIAYLYKNLFKRLES